MKSITQAATPEAIAADKASLMLYKATHSAALPEEETAKLDDKGHPVKNPHYDPLAQWKWSNILAICSNCGVVQHDQIDEICTVCQRRDLQPITKRKLIIKAHNAAIDAVVTATVEKLRAQYNEVFSKGYLYDDINQ